MSMKISTEEYIHGGTQKDDYNPSEAESCDCPLCGGKDYRKLHTERGVLGIVRCDGCGIIYVNPRLKEPEKVYWGDAETYFEEARLIFLGKLPHHRDPNYDYDLRIVRKYKPEGRFLDVGTNMGFFLRKARGKKWELFGVEPSPALSEFARKYFALNVKTAYLENAGFEDDYFDIVTMTDVFEHIGDPESMLYQVRRIIKPDGIVLIKVPNGNYNLMKLRLARLLGKSGQYDIFDSYEHLVHYSVKTLTLMLEKHGFKVIGRYLPPPVQIPVWHHLVGHYYQYPSPAILDFKHVMLRRIFHLIGRLESLIPAGYSPYFPSSIAVVARKKTR